MKQIQCTNCGASSWKEEINYRICMYCGTKFLIEQESSSGMELNSDIQKLLDKCRCDPKNAAKYANLIMDIDPTNEEALKYL